ncbi:MAG: prohibitin family protein [Candidatus Caenarcaniphilales bacterium]|nr:prohibitin family protein [Candidatus Caenarcaniphilales bacterium]
MNQRLYVPLIIGVMALIFLATLNPFLVVGAGEATILYNQFNGQISEPFTSGIYFKIPFVQHERPFNIRETVYDVETVAASKDLQNVHIKIRFLYNPIVSKLPYIYKSLGSQSEYAEKVFPSISKEVLKQVIAQFTAEEVIIKRSLVSSEISRQIIQRASIHGIMVKEVAITDLEFSEAFSQAIEAKQVAAQNLERAKKEAEAEIAKARGQAESARIINEASSTNPAFLKLREIDARVEVARLIAGSSNAKIYLPSESNLFIGEHK